MKEICSSVFWSDTLEDIVDACFLQTGHAPIVLVDESTHDHCWPLLNKDGKFTDADLIEIPSGEESKSLEIVEQVWSALTNLQVNRSTWVINLGGGVVTDFGGFVSSTFKRGLNFINIPTTLLAMVDASVGGKNGINFGGIKNHIGVFTKPNAVYLCPVFLETLPNEHLQNGFAEMLKHGLVDKVEHWQKLKNSSPILPDISQYITESVQIKAQIVEKDFRDTGERMKLNFGHSVGHAIEALRMTDDAHVHHGFAIAAGMIIEARISANKGILEAASAKEIEDTILQHFELDDLLNIPCKSLLPFIMQDKKNTNKMIFTLLDKPGHALINQEVTADELAQAIG